MGMGLGLGLDPLDLGAALTRRGGGVAVDQVATVLVS